MVPQRVILGILGFLGVVVCFAMRSCLSIAITEMVMPINTTTKETSSVCAVDTSFNQNTTTVDFHSIKKKGPQYNWTQEQQGWILSSFFSSYILSHLYSTIWGHRANAKWMVSLSILVIAICNSATPQILIYGEYYGFISQRILMGLFGGLLFPFLTVLLNAWAPPNERARLGALVLGGGQVGNLLSFYVSGLILTYLPWHVVFYFWSFLAIIWFMAFTLLCYNDPESHPFITKEEHDYLKSENKKKVHCSELPPFPWKQVMLSAPVNAIIFSQVLKMGSELIWTFLALDLPKYFKEVLGFSNHETGLYSALPQLFMWISTVFSGILCDYLVNQQYLSLVGARKFFTTLSAIFPAILFMAASYAECNRYLVVIAMTLAAGFAGCHYPGTRINVLDITTNYSGSLFAYVAGISCFASLLFPPTIGMMTPESTLYQWRSVFWLIFAVNVARVTIYSIWASADTQLWDHANESNPPECNKLTNDIENSNTNHELDAS